MLIDDFVREFVVERGSGTGQRYLPMVRIASLYVFGEHRLVTELYGIRARVELIMIYQRVMHASAGA